MATELQFPTQAEAKHASKVFQAAARSKHIDNAQHSARLRAIPKMTYAEERDRALAELVRDLKIALDWAPTDKLGRKLLSGWGNVTSDAALFNEEPEVEFSGWWTAGMAA